MKKVSVSLFICVVMVAILTPFSRASQVITEDTRTWAKEVLEEEKDLEALKGSNTLAVLYFNNKSGDKSLNPVQKGLTLMLITDLSNVSGIQIVERVRLQALMEEMGLGTSGLVKPDTEADVGKLIGAEWIVGGDILESIKVQANLLDVPLQKILGQPAAEGALSELLQVEKDVLFAIIELLKIELTPEEEAMLKKPCSSDVAALSDLFRAVDESDKEHYKKAANLYEEAIKKDPAICVAGAALEELQTLGLLKAAKRTEDILFSLKDRTSLTDQFPPEDATKGSVPPKNVTANTDITIIFE